jgi:rhodanese-related sulfurtransferase
MTRFATARRDQRSETPNRRDCAGARIGLQFLIVNRLPAFLVAALTATLLAQAEAPPGKQPLIKSASEPTNVTPDEAEKLINSRKDLVILDVRTADEFEDGHIKGAKNVSFLDDDFEQKLKEVEGKPVLVHCASGGRSAKAVKQMLGKQFPELYHMGGGMKAWAGAGKEVVKTN